MHKNKYPPLFYLLNINLLFLMGLLYPVYESDVYRVAIPLLLICNLASFFGQGKWLYTTNKAFKAIPLLPEIALMMSAFIIFFSSVEMLARVASNGNLITYHQPMQTMLPPGTDDWRMAHITADELRISDPVLWWRPENIAPYNSLGFKGKEVSAQKGNGVFRIMTYGDSNTDGPPQAGWTERLQTLLDASEAAKNTEFQVLNAGVAGYSSHQGLLRLRQEIEQYAPDLITVSFGWNDLARATNGADKAFATPSPLLVAVQKVLLKYRSYLALKHYLRKKPQTTKQTATTAPRVGLVDYLQNMKAFQTLAQSKNIPILFLTRPHRPTAQEMEKRPVWNRKVPAYNRALLHFGEENKTRVLDVQGLFERQHPDYFVDECHFNPAGHQVMAEYVYTNLLKSHLLPLPGVLGRPE